MNLSLCLREGAVDDKRRGTERLTRMLGAVGFDFITLAPAQLADKRE